MRTLITGCRLINEGTTRFGSLILCDDRIEDVIYSYPRPEGTFDRVLDVSGSLVLPGVIDSHVHFREPGMTHKGDISSESRAAAYGGVTTFFDMPNTIPATIDAASWQEKMAIAAASSHVNYAFFVGATRDNDEFLRTVDPTLIPGIKAYLGPTTGDLLVSVMTDLPRILRVAKEHHLLVMAHCETGMLIAENAEKYKEQYHTADPPMKVHHLIRDDMECYLSEKMAMDVAAREGAPLHIAHISMSRTLPAVRNVTYELCPAYLLFSADDYSRLGTRIKCNPAIKTMDHCWALRRMIRRGNFVTVATDHAPHLLEEKAGGALRAASGIPMIQYSLPAMLTLAKRHKTPLWRIVEVMCHNPALRFDLVDRGFLRKDYKADLAIISHDPWVVTADDVQSRCGWSPLEGMTLEWRVTHTICNGHIIYDNGVFDESSRGEAVTFNHTGNYDYLPQDE